MINSTKIVLFFSTVQSYDINKFAYKLSEGLPELGQATALPYSMIEKISVEQDLPIITFMSSKEVNLLANFNYISITVFNDNYDINNIIAKIYNVVSEFEFKFSRIGVVINKNYSASSVKDVLNEKIKDSEIYNSKQFILGWHKNISFKNIDVNFWQKYSVDLFNNDSLFATFDFNTKIGSSNIIDKQYAMDFIENSKNVIESLNLRS